MAKPNLFNSIQVKKPGRNLFDLTHDVKLSFNMGELIPVMVAECLPGDKWKLQGEMLLRFAPMVSPVMHRFDASIHYYFVPSRILWPGWEDFITGGREGTSAPAFPFIDIDFGGSNYTRLADYLGIPDPGQNPGATTNEKVNALPFAAYQKIWNEYYRDQNVTVETLTTLQNGENDMADFGELRKRAWEHDYFTSNLPWAQRGASVDVPLGEVQLNPDWNADGDVPNFKNGMNVITPGDLIQTATQIETDLSAGPHAYDPDGSLEVEPTTINTLRRAFRLQEWLETNARAGARYVENIFAHFFVKSPDKRLQRPEFIAGMKTPVMVSEILNTTGTTELPQGNMAGHGVAATSGRVGSYYCEEHGFIIGVMSVLPKTAYQQGLEKFWTKIDDKFQYYWPKFANIGEQETLRKELYAFTEEGSETFGYLPRYAEYRFVSSRVAGDFRDTLNTWHASRIFSGMPNLNQTFIECAPTHRIFAVTDEVEQKMYCHVLNKANVIRSMPKYGNPSM